MSLSELSIRRPVFAWMLMAGLIGFGWLCFQRLGISNLPDVNFPVVSVSLSLAGAAPEVMEAQVVDPVEDAIMQIAGIRSINSSSNQGSASISVEFDLSRDIDEAVQEIQTRLAQVKSRLPEDTNPPTVRKRNPEDQPILYVALTADDSVKPMEMMAFARDGLLNQFSSIEGVGDVQQGGYVDPALRIHVDAEKLRRFELSPDDLLSAIRNEHVEVPAGRLENGQREYNIRLLGQARTAAEFGEIILNPSTGAASRYVRLRDVATIVEGTADRRQISRYNGQSAVAFGILKRHGSNAVEVARLVREKVAELQPTLPKVFKLEIRSDSTRFVRQSVDSLQFALLASAVLTSLVCFLFLGSWSSTFNVLMAIPTSIIGTFIALYFFGFTLNIFTLLGLSLSIGIVVDDAIMMLENIVRHRELGLGRRQAAITGSREITFSALAATLAVVAIFLPVVFMKGVIGKYFFQYGVTVAVAVLFSLLEALTLTPMRCSQYLRVSHEPKGFALVLDHAFSRLANAYRWVLSRLVRRRSVSALVLVVSIGLFVGSIRLAKSLKSEMMPAQDQSSIMARMRLQPGSTLEMADEKSRFVEDFLRKQPEVEGVFNSVSGGGGGYGPGGGGAGAFLMVNLVDKSRRKETQNDLMNRYRDELKKIPQLKGIRVNLQDMSLRGFSSGRGFPVEVLVQGPNWDDLKAVVETYMDALEETKVFVDVDTDIQKELPQVELVPNRELLAARGVSLKAVTSTLNTLVGGSTLSGQTQYRKDGRTYQIMVRLASDQRDTQAKVANLRVRNNRGEMIPIHELVDAQVKPKPQTVTRVNRWRSIEVRANVAPGHGQEEAIELARKLAKEKFPPGYFISTSGSSRSFQESMQSLLVALLLGILVSYMVLAAQFNSFIHPVTILLALPFSISGAFLALYLTGQSINVYSMIGLILLMGIVKKNSILLVDFTNQLREGGKDVVEALIEACPVRLRPILMTSAATVAAALPEAVHLGPGSETLVPMAVAIIGGVIASTVLTLFVVPCAYRLVSRLERKDALLAEELRPENLSAVRA